ncbi:MAG: hypothetical protein LBV27_03055 [Oscillospiraceae bacterium]|nr:hypothetical protein [Oscillospiraceae bacterium]
MDLKENQYYNWLFTNYIQLYGRNVFTTDYYVDYYVTPEKDGLFYTIHSLLDYTNIDPALLVESGADMVRFIKTCINHGKYVEIRNLNEYYVEGSPAYGTETYYHKNLVFGWDDDNLYLLGQAGHVKLWKIKHSDLMRALDCEEGQLNIFTLNSIDSYYALNIDTIKDLLYEYWKGIDTNRRMEFIIPYGRQDERSVKSDPNSIARDQLPIFNNIYGMKIYDLFLENPRMFEYLLDDKRIPYFIYEHKKIMRDRVDFLRCKNHIIEEVSDQVAASADTVLNTARVLLNRCLKYQIAPKDSDRTRIKEVLRELKQLENQFYPQLIESLM